MKMVLTVLIFVVSIVVSVKAQGIEFTPVVNVGSMINTSDQEWSPSVSASGLTIYFHSNRAGGDGPLSIWSATRESTDDLFGEPSLVPGIDSSSQDFDPSISADELTLFFASTRNSAANGNIWQAIRTSVEDPFGAVTQINVSSSADDGGPEISADGLTLLFHSNRSGGRGSYDLWQATRATINDDFLTPVNLGAAVNSSTNDDRPSLSSDGLSLFFESKRSGGAGDWDIWMSNRATLTDEFTSPVNLTEINSSLADRSPDVTFDGRTLYFGSRRNGGEGNFDIWTTNIVPEPSSLCLVVLCFFTVVVWRFKKRISFGVSHVER